MRHENKTFRDEDVRLDDNEYIECTFDNCFLVYGGGSYALDRVRIVNNVHMGLEGAARQTIELLRFLSGFEVGRSLAAQALGLEPHINRGN